MRNKILLLTILTVAMQISFAAHPSLFFTSGDVAALKAKVLSGRSKEAFALMKARADGYLSAPVNPYTFRAAITGRAMSVEFTNLALTGYITDNQTYINKAISLMCAAASQSDVETFNQFNSHLAIGDAALAYAIGYDWLEPYMTSEQKSLIEAEIFEFGNWLYEHSPTDFYGEETVGRLAHNHQAVAHGGMGLCALVLNRSDTQAWVTLAADKIQKYFMYATDATGCSYEGMTYLAYGLQSAVTFAEAFENLTGTDIISPVERTSYIAQYYLWQAFPWGGGGVAINQTGDNLKPSGTVMYLIAKYGDGIGLWGWDKLIGQSGDKSYGKSDWLGAGASLPFVILWENQALQAVAPADGGAGLSKLFARGQCSVRGGWNDTDMLTTFTSGDARSGCWKHSDGNSFTFYAKGDAFAIDPGPAYLDSQYHNGVIIDDNVNGPSFVLGQILDFRDDGGAVYVKGKTSTTYTGIRQMLISRSSVPYLIIVDDLSVDQNTHKYSFMLHTAPINSLNVDPFMRTITIEGGRSSSTCYADCLWPAGYNVEQPILTADEAAVFKRAKINVNAVSARIITMLTAVGSGESKPAVVKSGTGDNMELVITFADGTADTVTIDAAGISLCRQSAFDCTKFKHDVNNDCKVDMSDFMVIAQEWFKCSDPTVFECEDMRN